MRSTVWTESTKASGGGQRCFRVDDPRFPSFSFPVNQLCTFLFTISLTAPDRGTRARQCGQRQAINEGFSVACSRTFSYLPLLSGRKTCAKQSNPSSFPTLQAATLHLLLPLLQTSTSIASPSASVPSTSTICFSSSSSLSGGESIPSPSRR